jgi:hypothetical protein
LELLKVLVDRRKALWSEAESVLNTAERRVEGRGGDLTSDEQQRLDDLYAQSTGSTTASMSSKRPASVSAS